MGQSSRTRDVGGALSAAEPSAVDASLNRSAASSATPAAVARRAATPKASSRATDAAQTPGSKAEEPEERPAASGHRFGPDLTCSECGTQWDAHQRDPTPCCGPDEPADVFLRRPDVS